MEELSCQEFSNGLDAAMQSHLEWVRRILRCAVLRTHPGQDVLNVGAHNLCHFDRWLSQNRSVLDSMDAQKAVTLELNHRVMHDAIREICVKMLAGEGGDEASLNSFETSQTLLIECLVHFKTLATQIGS